MLLQRLIIYLVGIVFRDDNLQPQGKGVILAGGTQRFVVRIIAALTGSLSRTHAAKSCLGSCRTTFVRMARPFPISNKYPPGISAALSV